MNGKSASILAIGIIIAAFVWGAFFLSTTNVASKSEGPSWIQEDLIKIKKYLANNGIE